MFSSGPTPDAVASWGSTLDALTERLSKRAWRSLRDHSRCLELTGSTLRVAARSDELRAWIRAGHLSAVVSELTRGGGRKLAIVPVPAAEDLGRDPYLEIDSFVASPANAGIRRRLRDFVATPPPNAGGLLIHGPGGSGKTYLLRALAAELSRSHPDRVWLADGAALSLGLVDAIRNDGVAEFERRLRAASALLIDDVDRLEDRPATQKLLLGALRDLAQRGARIVLSSGRSVEDLSGLDAGLRALMDSGERIPLGAPEWETRVAIVLDHVERWPVETTLETASLLAGHLRSDLARIDETLTSLMAQCTSSAELRDPDFVRQVLKTGSRRDVRVNANRVISLVARHFDVRIKSLRSANRSARITVPRQIAMYLVRRLCGLSYPEIGRLFGRHHTTALHSFRRTRGRIDQHEAFRATIALLEKELLQSSERGR